ncbi:hypothetical protein AT251_18265 [Enterovibrio nigricans]|nr:hypothetical protein AT251_18265 [Enterovibrio nigricans]
MPKRLVRVGAPARLKPKARESPTPKFNAYKKAPLFLAGLRCIGGTAGLPDATKVRSTFWGAYKKKA